MSLVRRDLLNEAFVAIGPAPDRADDRQACRRHSCRSPCGKATTLSAFQATRNGLGFEVLGAVFRVRFEPSWQSRFGSRLWFEVRGSLAGLALPSRYCVFTFLHDSATGTVRASAMSPPESKVSACRGLSRGTRARREPSRPVPASRHPCRICARQCACPA